VESYVRLDGLPEPCDHRTLGDAALATVARVAIRLLEVGNEAAAVAVLERYAAGVR
jgi:hypothetical protein